MSRLLLSILYALMICVNVVASPLQFRHYSTAEGLPSDCVRDICQTDDGFIWIATDGGVARFDGYKFRIHNLYYDMADMPDNFTSAVCEINGTLYVGTDSHIYEYLQASNSFKPIKIVVDNKELENIDIRHIVSDNDGLMWVVTASDGVYRLKRGDNNLVGEHFNIAELNDHVGQILVDSRNNVWAVGVQGGGKPMRFDKVTNKFKPINIEGVKINANALAEDSLHRLWIGTWDDGLICVDPFELKVLSQTDPVNRRLFGHIHTLMSLADGSLLVGSDEGLVVVDPNGNISQHTHNIFDPYSLSDQFVYPMCLDNEGGLWIGTFYGGLNYKGPELKIFERLTGARQANNEGYGIISEIKEDSNGRIWIASDDGGLNMLDPKSKVMQHISLTDTKTTASPNLHALCFDGDDLWIGSFADGVFVYNTNTGAIRNFKASASDPKSIQSDNCYAIYIDSRNTIWVGSGNWINTYNRQSDDFNQLKDVGATIISVIEDIDGSLWFATQGNGIFRYDPASGKWTNYKHNSSPGSLLHDHVNCIILDSKKSLLIATHNGLNRYDRANDCFVEVKPLSRRVGVFSIVEDDGCLWMTTSIGLVKMINENQSEVFTQSDGLSSSQFMPNSMLRSSSGKIYLGTRSGVTCFYPYQIKLNNHIPPVVFTGFETSSTYNSPDHANWIGDLNNNGKIVLQPEDYVLTISFAALSYTNPEKNQYAFKLEGFDKDWVDVGSDNKATYTNLPPGNYKFCVRGSNGDNVWNDEGVYVDVEVLAPWYQSTFMKVLYWLLAAVAIVFFVIAILRRKDKAYKVEITRINKDKEIEVYQVKLSFFTMIAHEIRTPVSLIIGPLEKILRSGNKVPEPLARDLSVIERNSQRLLTLTNQLLDFKKVEDSSYGSQFSHVNIRPLLYSIVDRFRPSFEQRSITFDVKCDVDDDFSVDIDSEAVTKLISNLLNNARKFTRTRVIISLEAAANSDMFSISVSDDGPGISKQHQRKIFQPFYQINDEANPSPVGTGLGLSIVNNVVKAHGGNISIDSVVGKGTTFIVSLPMHQDTAVDAEISTEVEDNIQDEKSATATVATNRPLMLVVDDNDELCNFIANSFSDRYDIVTASDGVEALEILKSRNVSFIISDWMMPRLDGVGLCKAVRNDVNFSHIPFVLLTAKTDNASRITGLNCGADAYVDKPFSLQVLEARIDNLISMRELLRKKFSQSPLEPIASVAPNTQENELLNKLTQVIEDNFSNPDLDIDLLASKLDISRSSLYNKIKSLIDVSPNELIRITRLKHAARLLTEQRYRINEVCYMVGFNSNSYFSKCFLKQFGMTPTDFVHSLNK